jgi:hypothetical protein
MTASTKAVGNGSTTTTPADPAKRERPHGYGQVREAEVYHASSVMHDAVFEAERLCDAINRAVSDAYFDRNDGRSTVETAESYEVRDKATEALRCLRIAEDYLYRLAPVQPEPSF